MSSWLCETNLALLSLRPQKELARITAGSCPKQVIAAGTHMHGSSRLFARIFPLVNRAHWPICTPALTLRSAAAMATESKPQYFLFKSEPTPRIVNGTDVSYGLDEFEKDGTCAREGG